MAINDEIPKSRLTLTYRTEIDGERVEKALPFKLLVMGDLSQEVTRDAKTASAERDLDLDERVIRTLNGTNLDTVMADMGMTIGFTVPNRISSDDGEMRIDLKIDSVRAFTPERIVEQVDELKALVLLKKLLGELQGNLDNRKKLRNMIRDFNNWRRHSRQLPEEIAAIQAELDALDSQDPESVLAATKLRTKIEQLTKRQTLSKSKLDAFFADLETNLSSWTGFELPGAAAAEEEPAAPPAEPAQPAEPTDNTDNSDG